MASRTSRREWVRGLPWVFGVGRYDRKQIHSVLERSVGYGFLIGDNVHNHPNPHLYQTGSKAQEITQPMNVAVVDAGRHSPHYTLKEEVAPTQANNSGLGRP